MDSLQEHTALKQAAVLCLSYTILGSKHIQAHKVAFVSVLQDKHNDSRVHMIIQYLLSDAESFLSFW